jgi:hypothetical protein
LETKYTTGLDPVKKFEDTGPDLEQDFEETGPEAEHVLEQVLEENKLEEGR